MTLSDTTGGEVSSDNNAGSGLVEGLSFADRISFHRSAISFSEQLNYLPSSSFGPTGTPGDGTGGGSVFEPGQTVLLGQGNSIGNTFTTEVDAYLTPRTSLTFAGGYSLQHYFEGNSLDYGDIIFRGGYNYQLNQKDTIAVSYTFTGYRYSNFDQSIDAHAIQVLYGHRVTGRLAFQVGAGPQFVFSNIPISGTGTGATTAVSAMQVTWSLFTALQYQAGRTSLGLSYNHGVGGGAGVFAGSIADTFTGSATRQVSRTFSSGISAGYNRNQGTAIGTTTSSNQTYDYWFGGASLSHPVGRSLGLTLSYQLQYQSSNAAFCVAMTCGTSVLRNLISVGVGWHERPLLF